MKTYQQIQLIKRLIHGLSRHPKTLIALPIIASLWFGYEHFIARPAMSFMGLPEVINAHPQNGLSHILRNQGFMLEYSEGLANPLWVTYKVGPAQYDSGKRPGRFSDDWRSWQRVNHRDYSGSGYDRGHMAPNYVIASRYGRQAQLKTFLMTNISPQKGTLNQKSWQRLEELVANDFSKKYGDIWVVTGPIFNKKPKRLKNSQVAIPNAFYKILITPMKINQAPQALAFIFPQNANAKASLMNFVTTIDEVEKQSGLELFSQLPDDIENLLESQKTPEKWGLAEVANRKNRY